MKYPSETRHVQCRQGKVGYMLTRKPVKNINIRIKPDGRVLVSASNRVPIDYIDKLIKEKEEFIFGALKKYEAMKKQVSDIPRRYEEGEGFKILGKKLYLKVIEGNTSSVTSDNDFIYLTVKDKYNIRSKEILINKWLKEMQTNIFHQISKEVHKKFEKYGVKYPLIKIRKMKSRWGSCHSQRGIITLNSKLVEAPRTCIEYVVMHEFAHFIHPNHSKNFYDFLTALMPDWKERKKELDKII